MASDAEMAMKNLFERDEVIAGIEKHGARRQIRKTRRRRGGASDGDIVTTMMTIRDQVKLYHWQTHLFSRHKATDDLVDKLDTNIDTFVETYMGKYGRPKVTRSIKLSNFTESAAKTFVSQQRVFLSRVLPRMISPEDTDLLNIRDEILGDLNHVLYLFTLA
jgi:hypothetical protein